MDGKTTELPVTKSSKFNQRVIDDPWNLLTCLASA